MKHPSPVPLFPGYDELATFANEEYPEVFAFLNSGEPWWIQHWSWGADFLKYIGRNKSEHTYVRFRNEIERFLLWTLLYSTKPIDTFRKADILDYADFCWKPPQSWIGAANSDRFKLVSGVFHANTAWRPFRIKTSKNAEVEGPDKKKYKPSQATLAASFTALISFYKYLMNEEICYGNPAQLAKHDCRHFIQDARVKKIRRLSGDQWQYVLETAETMANKFPRHERSLFVIAALKALFLRISELSERRNWSPTMGHFWQDENGSWWLKVLGKGRKLRDVTVPTQFLPYLKRYRTSRGQSPLPSPGDNSPLVEKIRGQGGVTSRHLSRLIQEVFDLAYERMRADKGDDCARQLREASTHWLRHTGASMEIERGRALKDLSEDLGHASMATTDTVYVQSERRKRAASGKRRSV